MKKGMMIGLSCLAGLVGLGLADDLVPVAVSPGTEQGPAVVRQSCPTFSWTAVSWAQAYKVVVFKAVNDDIPAYEEIAAVASPVLAKEIPGLALSWTPSADEPLVNGGSYVWYVGAMANSTGGSWSEGRTFVVAESAGWGVVAEPRGTETGEMVVRKARRDKNLDLTAEAKERFNLADDCFGEQMIEVEAEEGESNTFYGQGAGYSILNGGSNAFFGRSAGYANTVGNYNTFVGRSAGRNNTTGTGNTMVGFSAGFESKTATNNTFVGRDAGRSNTEGHTNVFLGASSGHENTDGNNNTYVGVGSGFWNTVGKYNTFVGSAAGCYNIDGSSNIFIGYWAGLQNQTGLQNTFIGLESGYGNKTGCGNVFLGFRAGRDETGSYKLYISNNRDKSPLIYGDFSTSKLNFNGRVRINPSTSDAIVLPAHILDVGTAGAYCNGGAWVNGSSREFKENIEELTTEEALQAFEELQPVKYQYKENREETCLGFIAEDVPELVATIDRKGLSPMDVVAVLTKVIQEQQKSAREQMKVIEGLTEAVAELQEGLKKLNEETQK